ncbi:MAG: hypothetical protein IKI37_10740, partial [Oscillospiraceae bacterium]|nr:hypothetical protein [Oscillospiraceae bacterium]
MIIKSVRGLYTVVSPDGILKECPARGILRKKELEPYVGVGTNSIGWAVVNEAENQNEKSSIIKLGVRVNPLTVDEL